MQLEAAAEEDTEGDAEGDPEAEPLREGRAEGVIQLEAAGEMEAFTETVAA